MNETRSAVFRAIESAWPDQVAALQALVRERSTLGNEAGAQRLMQASFREMGLETHCFEPDLAAIARLPGFSPPEWSYRGRQNVVGVWHAAAPGGRSLILNGHVDVVSPSPVGHWTHDPWGAEIAGDRLYGRGALDMKAGLMAMAWAVRALRVAGVTLRGDVILQSVIEEECTGNGTLSCLARGFRADGCLIAEPFYGQALVAQVGVLWGRVHVYGSGAHVRSAKGAINAIEQTYTVIRALRELEARLNAERHPAFQGVSWPVNFNPGIIRGGDWPSTVPSECELEFRMGFYPGTSAEAAQTMVRQHILNATADDPWLGANPPEITFYGFQAEGTSVAFDESPVIRTLDAIHRDLTGRPLEPLASRATTDSRFFPLYYDIPATCYGPNGSKLHGVDEYVDLATLVEVTKVIAAFALEWCGDAATAPSSLP